MASSEYLRKAMSTLSGGFNARKATLQKQNSAHGQRAQISEMIERFSQSTQRNLEDDEETDWEQQLSPAQFSRIVQIPATQQLDTEGIPALNELYVQERNLLQSSQAAILAEIFSDEEDVEFESSPEDEKAGNFVFEVNPLTNEQCLLELRDLHGRLRRQVDLVTFGSAYSSMSGTTSLTNCLPLYAAMILEDFFQICQTPNEAEIHMLTEACAIEDTDLTEKWFARKREETMTTMAAKHGLATEADRDDKGLKDELRCVQEGWQREFYKGVR